MNPPNFQPAVRTKPVRKPSILDDANPHWKGGQIVSKDGRVMIHSPSHPNPSKGCYVYRYRLVMEKHLGRFLDPSEVVHHINGKNDDDRLENLQLMSNAEHSRMHGANYLGGRWAKDFDKCVECGTTDAKHKSRGRCTRCTDRARRPKKS